MDGQLIGPLAEYNCGGTELVVEQPSSASDHPLNHRWWSFRDEVPFSVTSSALPGEIREPSTVIVLLHGERSHAGVDRWFRQGPGRSGMRVITQPEPKPGETDLP